jgi:hypothetical protein
LKKVGTDRVEQSTLASGVGAPAEKEFLMGREETGNGAKGESEMSWVVVRRKME